MWVQNYMTRQPVVVEPEDTLTHARNVMLRAHVRHLPVVREGRLEGVISDRDVRDYLPLRCREEATHAACVNSESLTVEQVMSRKPLTVRPDDMLADAAAAMLERGVGCVPVVAGTRLVGLVTRSDVLRALASERASAMARPRVD